MDLQDIVSFLRSFWTLWMVLLFLGIVAYALWPRNKGKFDQAASIPLRDEDGQEK